VDHTRNATTNGRDTATIAAADPGRAPDGPTAGADGALGREREPSVVPSLVVRVLGRLEVEGITGTIRRRAVQRALVVLAVNYGRPVTSEELRGALASDEMSEPTAATLRSELSRLRSVLPDGLLPDQAPGVGYRLAGPVHVDWAAFKALAAQADGCDGLGRLEAADRALSLVRGPVLEHGGWHGIEQTVWEIEAAIEALAADCATRALDAGRASLAGKAAAQGLLAVPGSPALWQLRLRAAESGSGENVKVLTDRARLLGVLS
jgi:DNA-binding winged helix-turn-helix (wHTH) protein